MLYMDIALHHCLPRRTAADDPIGVDRGIQGFAGVCRGLHWCAGVNGGLWGCAEASAVFSGHCV